MSKAFIKLALSALACNQKELAAKLNVSPTQITKWKQGEHMAFSMETKLREILDIGEMDPDFVLLAGTFDESVKWAKLIRYLAESAEDSAETGYVAYPLQDEENVLCGDIFDIVNKIGVSIPKKFPAELDVDYENYDGESFELFLENPYVRLIYDIFMAFTNVYAFYAAYVQELLYNDDLSLYKTAAENIEPCLLDLAACKIDVDQSFAPNFTAFKQSVLRDYEKWLTAVKYKAMRAGLPLRAELLDLVYNSSEELCSDAEAESLGFNRDRPHPDIYMNELLVGMRVIHQVLPFIMKKMGIYEEFELKNSDLIIGGDKD